MLVVPGSFAVKKEAEAEGLDKSKGEDPALYIKGFFQEPPKP